MSDFKKSDLKLDSLLMDPFTNKGLFSYMSGLYQDYALQNIFPESVIVVAVIT